MFVALRRLFLCLKEQHAKKVTSFIICLSEVGIVINNSVKISSYEFVVVISDGCVYALKRSLKPVAGSVDE